MDGRLMLLCVVLVPCIGAFALPFLGRISAGLRNIVALALAVVPLVLVFAILPAVASGGTVKFSANFGNIFDLILYADGLAVFMAIVSVLISSIIIFYSFGYISHYENQNEYYLMVLLFLGGMLGLIFSENLIFLYLFWEITALTSWRLIGFLILAGILSKSATLPFHTWLPDAGVAPSPVTALLHAALLVKIGVYVFARLFIATFTVDEFWHTVVPIVAGASAIVSACAAMIDTDLKRIIAYSTVSQIGFIFLGLSIGNEIGVAGALLYILMHGLAKGGLFLCAGIVEQNTKTKNITQLGGLIKTMPVTAMAFLFCVFSVMGIPPFGGFFSKYMVMTSTIRAGDLWIMFVFLLGAIMTIIYLLRVFNLVFLGEAKTPPVREGSPVMVISVAMLAALSLAAGFFVAWPNQFVMSAIQNLPGVIR
jgi:NADH:ubiquinone oxidoreductase subunit 5 (subunit L)/multisubunit Na+/H+ antiporter MnhA subunit